MAEVGAHCDASSDDPIGVRCRLPVEDCVISTTCRLSRPARPGKSIVRLGTNGRATTSDPGTGRLLPWQMETAVFIPPMLATA